MLVIWYGSCSDDEMKQDNVCILLSRCALVFYGAQDQGNEADSIIRQDMCS